MCVGWMKIGTHAWPGIIYNIHVWFRASILGMLVLLGFIWTVGRGMFRLLGSTLRRNRLVPRGSILNLTRAAACGSYWRLTQHLSTSNTNTDTLTFANVATLPPVRSVFSSNELSQSDHQPWAKRLEPNSEPTLVINRLRQSESSGPVITKCESLSPVFKAPSRR